MSTFILNFGADRTTRIEEGHCLSQLFAAQTQSRQTTGLQHGRHVIQKAANLVKRKIYVSMGILGFSLLNQKVNMLK